MDIEKRLDKTQNLMERVEATKEQFENLNKEESEQKTLDGNHFESAVLKEFSKNNINDKDVIKKHFKKMSNNSLETYERWKSMILLEKWGGKLGIFTQDIVNRLKRVRGEEELTLDGICSAMFLIGTRYKINSEITELLLNTEVEIKYNEIPHPISFIEFEIPITIEDKSGDIEIFGLLLSQGTNSLNRRIVHFSLFGRDLKEGNCFYQRNNISDMGIEKVDSYKFGELGEKIDKVIPKLVCNLLNFINHPEVELIKSSRKQLRDSLIKKGRLGVPDLVEINLTGKLRKYIYEDLPKQKEAANNYSYKFWVRGHWMNFTSERYVNMKGKKKWVLPYIKGRGELISKDYYLGEKERQWEHEKRMKKIIQSIFPDKELKNNNRTELNGLEIDCYIPELKLGFEYNGEQHYNHVEIFHKTIKDFEAQKERDIKKNELAKEKGIRLITIRYDELLTEKLILSKINGDTNGKGN